MMGDDMMMEEETGPKKGLIIGIVIAVVVGVIAGLAVFFTIRKKKKAAKLMADDLLDLEAEIDSENKDKD